MIVSFGKCFEKHEAFPYAVAM